jgi:hypothetical protein
MKKAVAISLLALLLSALTGAVFVNFATAQEEAKPTLEVASKPGGSIIVQSSAINNGLAVTVTSGQQGNWSVPYGASATLTATDFASGLSFGGWDGLDLPDRRANPVTITIYSATKATANFKDKSAPNPLAVTLQTPRSTTYNQKSVPVSFTVSNPNAGIINPTYFRRVYSVRFYLDGAPLDAMNLSSLKLSGDAYSYNSTIFNLAEGEHSLYVLACAQFDMIHTPPPPYLPGSPDAGSDVSEMAYFVVDTIAPHISILSPEAGAYVASDVPVVFDVDEAASKIAYSLDGQENVMVAENVTLSGLTSGEHTLTVYAWDAAGNFGASETVTFAVGVFPSTLVIAVIISVSIVAAGLLFYFKKSKR